MNNEKKSFDLDKMLNEISREEVEIPNNLSVDTQKLLINENEYSKITPFVLGAVIMINILIMISNIGIIVYSVLSGNKILLQIIIHSMMMQLIASIVVFIFKDEVFKKLVY